MLPEITQEEFSAALDRCSAELLAETGAEPPIDAALVARRLGLDIALSSEQPERGRFMRLTGRPNSAPQGAIIVRPEERPERLQWSIAHEVGEATAQRVFQTLGIRPDEAPPAARESIANMLAARILLPRDIYAATAKASEWDLLSMKQVFATASHELIARRMLDFALPIAITIWDNGRRTCRRANIGRRAPPVSDLERSCRDLAHASGASVVEESTSSTIQVWPIHEAEWKREIMRTLWHDTQESVEMDWDQDAG